MHFDLRRFLIASCLAPAFFTAVKTQTRAPVIWDDAALAKNPEPLVDVSKIRTNSASHAATHPQTPR